VIMLANKAFSETTSSRALLRSSLDEAFHTD
jgi:hypothetical protein